MEGHMTSTKGFENNYRRLAKRLNLKLEKSNTRNWSIDNRLGWRIVDLKNNVVIAGQKWDLTIDEAAQVLEDILEMAKAT
jgi:hypothetical protein